MDSVKVSWPPSQWEGGQLSKVELVGDQGDNPVMYRCTI